MHRRDLSPPPAADARAALARGQAAIVRALQGDVPPPDGFKPAHVQRAADSLGRKRARSVRNSWPAVAESLGDRFDGEFDAYAVLHVLPPEPQDDGLYFARWLNGRGLLDDVGRIELAAAKVARGFPARLVLLKNMPWVALVYRWADAVHILSPGAARRP